jgi:hypothetical protein
MHQSAQALQARTELEEARRTIAVQQRGLPDSTARLAEHDLATAVARQRHTNLRERCARLAAQLEYIQTWLPPEVAPQDKYGDAFELTPDPAACGYWRALAAYLRIHQEYSGRTSVRRSRRSVEVGVLASGRGASAGGGADVERALPGLVDLDRAGDISADGALADHAGDFLLRRSEFRLQGWGRLAAGRAAVQPPAEGEHGKDDSEDQEEQAELAGVLGHKVDDVVHGVCSSVG